MPTTPLPVFVWPLHDPISKSFIDTIQNFLLEIHTSLNSIKDLPQLKQQTHLLSQQFQALLETFVHQLKLAYTQYSEDYFLLAQDKERIESIQLLSKDKINPNANTEITFQPCPLPNNLNSTIRYICRQSRILFNNLIMPEDFFNYIQSLESIKSILALFSICHISPADNITAQFLSWYHQINPISIEYYQYLASVDSTLSNQIPLPFNKGVHSETYWTVCGKLLAQGRVVELFQLLDINPLLDRSCGIEGLTWRTILTTAILMCPSLHNVLTEYTSIQYNIPTNSCCLFGALDLCTDANHSNPGIKVLTQKLSRKTPPRKPVGLKSRKFGAIDVDDDNKDVFNTTIPQNVQLTAWEYLGLEARFQSWQGQISHLLRLGSQNSPQFGQDPAYKLFQVLGDLDSTINELFFQQIYSEIEPITPKFLSKNGAPRFNLVWLDITLYMLLYRFPSASRVGFEHIIQESFDSCIQFIELQIECKKCTQLQLQVYSNSIASDQFSDAVRSIGTHNILHSLFMLESLVTFSTKQIIKTLEYNYTLLPSSTTSSFLIQPQHKLNDSMSDDIDIPHLGVINLNTNRTNNGDEFISIFGFDWILAIIAEFVFHASKIDLSTITQSTVPSQALQLTTNKKMQKFKQQQAVAMDDIDSQDNLQYPYLLPFFPPSSQLKTPPLDIRQRYLYRFFDGILFGLYSSSEYICLLSQVFDKEQYFISQYIDIIYNPMRLSELDSNQMKSLLQSYNDVDQIHHTLLQTLSITHQPIDLQPQEQNKTQVLLGTTLSLSSFFGKTSTQFIAMLFNFHSLCYNPLYIHLIPSRSLTAGNNASILQPYQVRIIQYLTKCIHLRCNLPTYIFNSSHQQSNDIIQSINNSNSARSSFSQVDMNNFITLIMHQIVTHNSQHIVPAIEGSVSTTTSHQLLPQLQSSPQITSHVANLSQILSQSTIIDQNFKNALLVCIKHVLFSQILQILYIDYYGAISEELWQFSFLSNPHIQITVTAVTTQLNADIVKHNLHLPQFLTLNLSTPPAGFTINSIPLQFNHKTNPRNVFIAQFQHLFTNLYALNCTSLITFICEHIISGCYHTKASITHHYRTNITQLLSQIVSATSSTNIVFNIPTVCEQWDIDYVGQMLLSHQSSPCPTTNILPPPFPTQPMSPTHYIYTLYLFAQFWGFTQLLSNLTPTHFQQQQQQQGQTFKFSPLIPSLHPYPTLHQTLPTNLHEFTSPRDPITTHPLPINPYLATTTSLLSKINQTSYAAIIFTSSFHLLIELFHICTVDYHKRIIFEWFAIYSTLIQTHLYFKLLDDAKLNNIALSEDQVHNFFRTNSASPQLTQPISQQQQHQHPSPSFVLPIGAMIDFTKHKDNLLASIIISYNHLISLQSISHLNLFITNIYLSPQRSFCLLPIPILSQLLTHPLLFELFDVLPQKLLRYGLLQTQSDMDNISTAQLFEDEDLQSLYSNYTAINSQYVFGYLTNHFIPHKFTSTHPLFPTEPQLLVQEEKNVISQFFSFISTQTPATLPTDNLATPLIMDSISNTSVHYYQSHKQNLSHSSSNVSNAAVNIFTADFSLPQYEQKWTQFSHGLLLSVNSTPGVQ